ncbi:MAG: ImmA/IrrE family metallo-endopeptidase [Candidatus Scalindua sp.]|nr:ImmA/IrrE family metallo-endopeptidase [Candidatus Scalindua sp.]
MTFRFNGSVQLRKKDFKQTGEFYHGQIVLHFIILNFKKYPKERKMDVVAHEIAHFILGHHRKKKINMGVMEREADDLVESWRDKRAIKTTIFDTVI